LVRFSVSPTRATSIPVTTPDRAAGGDVVHSSGARRLPLRPVSRSAASA
jgi:hypothetical protein